MPKPTVTQDAPLLGEHVPDPPQFSAELAPRSIDENSVSLFERLARDPNVDPEKLERLIAMQERIMRHNAKAAFDAAFAKMQPRIPVIDEHGRIEVKGSLRNTYAPLEDIHEVVKPICAEFGFAIRHKTEWPSDKPGIVRVRGILSHEQGHSEDTEFEAPMDRSEYRTDIQSFGSTISYGRRYTTLDLLNISTRKADNDGRSSGRPAPPDGFDKIWKQLEAAGKTGQVELDAIWENLEPEHKNYIVKHMKDDWATVRKNVPKGRR